MTPIINVVLPVFAIILTGYLAGRFKWMGEASTDALNRFVYYLALPVLLFHSMASVDAAQIFNWPFIAAYMGGTSIGFVLALVVVRAAFRASMPESALFAMVSVFANTGYMGIPLAVVAYGPEAALPAGIATVFQTIVFIAIPQAMVEAGRSGGARVAHVVKDSLVGLIKSPIVIGPVAGMVWSLAGLPLPAPVETYCKVLGAAAGPGALIALGLFLVGKPIREGSAEVGLMTLFKLLVHPLIVWVLATQVLEVRDDWIPVVVMLAALPPGASCFVLAQQHGVYVRRTSTATLVATVLAVVTIGLYFAFPHQFGSWPS